MTNRFKLWVAILLGLGLLAILGAKWGYEELREAAAKPDADPTPAGVTVLPGDSDETGYDRR